MIEVDVRTMWRWSEQLRKGVELRDRRKEAAASREPANKLTTEGRKQIVELCNQPQNQSLPPSQIVPMIADQREYVGSESTCYRVLGEKNQLNRRGPENRSETQML